MSVILSCLKRITLDQSIDIISEEVSIGLSNGLPFRYTVGFDLQAILEYPRLASVVSVLNTV
ncbi:hypothetical protein HKK80_09055 [Halonotius sp. F2-221B]|uniref:hypothetical protein n=1 Tax=Halonotius sp. F2-221B TaxID=2731620 RepID=UPI00398A916C